MTRGEGGHLVMDIITKLMQQIYEHISQESQLCDEGIVQSSSSLQNEMDNCYCPKYSISTQVFHVFLGDFCAYATGLFSYICFVASSYCDKNYFYT